MKLMENPTIHGPITPEQAQALSEAPDGAEAPQAVLTSLGVDREATHNDVAMVSASGERSAHYASLDPKDAGTRLLPRTAEAHGLPALDSGGRRGDVVSAKREPVVISKPGDPGHEERVAAWQLNQDMYKAAAVSVAKAGPERL